MSAQFFLTAWDPSDLPGGSVDPLGFDRAYGAIADLFLPGLTNVGSQPRYFAVLCAGALLADTAASESPRDERATRSEAVLRFERLWCLAHALTDDADGIRGVRYAMAQVERLQHKRATETGLDFPLLSHQARYGVVGIYGAVAGGLRLIDADTLRPSADLGARLGALFRKATKPATSIVEAARGDVDRVPLVALRNWVESAHIRGDTSDEERACYREALHLNPLRARSAALLAETGWKGDETELDVIQRLLTRLRAARRDPDIADALRALLALEESYRAALLVFERLLWLCRIAVKGAVTMDDVTKDPIIVEALPRLVTAKDALAAAFDAAETGHLAPARARVDDIRAFVGAAADAASDAAAVVDVVVQRHAAVQTGKVTRGQRKAPYVEKRDGHYTLCLGRAADSARDVKTFDDVRPHEYRVRAALRLSGVSV